MQPTIFLFLLIGFALCKPQPQFLFGGLFNTLRQTVEKVENDILGTAKQAPNATHNGIFGHLRGAAGTLAVKSLWCHLKMPPKKDGDAPRDGQKNTRKKIKPKKKKDECPSRIRKTDRVVLNGQARDIIAKVYDFMKREAMAEYAEKLTNARWRTATAVGVSEKTVSRILKDRNKKRAGSAVAGTGVLIAGKVGAVEHAGEALGDLLTGNVTGAASNLASAAGNCLGGDVAALGIAATGVAGAAGEVAAAKLNTTGKVLSTLGEATGDVVKGKLTAIGDLGAAVNALGSGNLTAAINSFDNATSALVAGDAAALGTLFNGTLEAFGR